MFLLFGDACSVEQRYKFEFAVRSPLSLVARSANTVALPQKRINRAIDFAERDGG
jgi:hypothetical protein